MKKYAIAALAVVALGAAIAVAQVFTMPPPAGVVVLGCVYQSSPPTLTTGQTGFAQCDSTGHLSTGGGGPTANVAVVSPLGHATVDTAAVSIVPSATAQFPTYIVPSSNSTVGITPVVSGSAEASHVLKAGAGNAYSIYATNLTATAGFLVVLNSTSAPGDGAITPIACAPLSPNGVASINYAPGPPGVFSTGITAVITSAASCFTKTTGVITAFISGSVQ